MAAWDEIDLLDMEFQPSSELYTYPCPCGDDFIMPVEYLIDFEDIATCPSCSLLLRIKYDPDEFLKSVEIVPAIDSNDN